MFWEQNGGKENYVPSIFLRDKKIKLNEDIESSVSWMSEQQK